MKLLNIQKSIKTQLSIKFVIINLILILPIAVIIFLWQESKIKQLKIEVENYKKEIGKTKADVLSQQNPYNKNDYFFEVYSRDSDTMEKIILFYIKLPNELPLTEKLKILSQKLSTIKFSYLPIDILKIEQINGKNVAIINLSEPKMIVPSSITWKSHYFQGSAGGSITTTMLVDTFLQKNYTGEWIDGVQFYYNGEPIPNDYWDHINLSNIKYRKDN
ncbi:MAG TPA: hypothetical protein DCX95_00600 [Elusimicrobia bacterium]|nr:hypothetical protein [Elusimicrobiota bacterium]